MKLFDEFGDEALHPSQWELPTEHHATTNEIYFDEERCVTITIDYDLCSVLEDWEQLTDEEYKFIEKYIEDVITHFEEERESILDWERTKGWLNKNR